MSRLNHTVAIVRDGLEAYDFMNAAKAIESLVDEFSNWYIRRSRERFWGNGLSADKCAAYRTMKRVLLEISKLIAPFTPFLADEIYSNLSEGGSVHLTDYPTSDHTAIDTSLEVDMSRVRQIVELARIIRNDTGIKNRQPLSELIIVTDEAMELGAFSAIILDEMNVKGIRVERHNNNLTDYTLKMNLKLAGPKYGKLISGLQTYLRNLNQLEIGQLLQEGFFEFTPLNEELIRIPMDEVLVERQAKIGYASATGYNMTVSLNTTLTPDLEKEGMIRELIRAIQDLRKKCDLPIDKRIDLIIETDEDTQHVILQFEQLIHKNVLLRSLSFGLYHKTEQVQIADRSLRIGFS
jgi:isoleucyl-tRNA synthetase